jgi:septal ring factor EnvC (AmiA/AmiB activator)
MSETTELAVLEIKPEQAPALYVPNGLDGYLDQIRQLASEVPDVTTKKGRERIGSLARMVGSSKKAIEEPGRAYLKHLKEAVKPAEEELRRFTRECDTIRDNILAPRTEWDAEQDRKAAEEQMIAWHVEALEMNEAHDKAAAEKFEADHELALLMNKDIDRERKEAKAEAERQRIAHEEEIKRQAVEQARIEAEQKAQQEREASARREADLKAAAEQAERERIESQQRAEREATEAREKAEREKQQAIEAEQLKARQEADRIKREAEQKEATRLAEEKRVADEAAARAANEKHRKTIGTEIVTALLGRTSITREQAIEVLIALKDNEIPHTRITY